MTLATDQAYMREAVARLGGRDSIDAKPIIARKAVYAVWRDSDSTILNEVVCTNYNWDIYSPQLIEGYGEPDLVLDSDKIYPHKTQQRNRPRDLSWAREFQKPAVFEGEPYRVDLTKHLHDNIVLFSGIKLR